MSVVLTTSRTAKTTDIHRPLAGNIGNAAYCTRGGGQGYGWGGRGSISSKVEGAKTFLSCLTIRVIWRPSQSPDSFFPSGAADAETERNTARARATTARLRESIKTLLRARKNSA